MNGIASFVPVGKQLNFIRVKYSININKKS